MQDYGVEVYRYGAIFHGDGRKRRVGPLGWRYIEAPPESRSRYRGVIRAFSRASQRNLEFAAANVAGTFHALLTLTYHANVESWENDASRNHRIAARSKRDLNRFLTRMRPKLGPYIWVQEFQQRGVIHYHVLCGEIPAEHDVRMAWCRATGEVDDVAALENAVKVDAITSERAARNYVGRYLGKARQKVLPVGVAGAGRWWGRSRSLKLMLLEEVVAGEKGMRKPIPEGLRIQRCLRKYVSKVFKGKFRGGMFLDWGGQLTARLEEMSRILKAYYGTPKRAVDLLDEGDWEPVEFKGGPVPLPDTIMRREIAAKFWAEKERLGEAEPGDW
jgi:hypothetical protein